MRSGVSAGFALVVAGCSSAGTLPSGGPYGGSAFDASPADVGTTPVFIVSGTGTGASGGSVASYADGGTSAATGASSSTATTPATPPTWDYLFTTYLSSTTTPATIGACDSVCHATGVPYHTQCDTAADCYQFIGTPTAQATNGALSNGGGLFTWDMGYMPMGGPTSEPQAELDFAAWIAAGSPGPVGGSSSADAGP